MNVKESPVKTDVGGNPVSKDVSGREVSSDSEETTVQKIPKKSQQIKTDKPRPHACSICTRAFARLEHLKRHERSHTNEKPFQCATCGRCFARRDLVLRHQQKLHFISSSNSRRNSAKEGEQSEHINILRNNTDANAPLPDMNDDIKDFNSSTHSHENSPDKIGMRINAHHPMRDSLFSHQPSFASSGSSIIPSPMPTHSNNNTPPTGVHSGPAIGDLHSYQNPSPRTASNGSPNKSVMSKQLGSDISVDVPKLPSANNGIAPQQFRHSSFSAASGMSYTNLKDSLDIQQNNVVFETPSQVDFATPQQVPHDRNYYGGVDLTSLDIDWNNIDSLDLGSSFLPKSKKSSATNLAMNFPEITSKQRSNRNLQQYFDLNVIATHQFQNPSHPHHIKGTTPLEFGVNPPFDPEVQNSVNGQIGPNQIHLNEDAIEHKAIRRASRENSEVAKRIKLEKTVEQEDWLKDIVSSTTSHESSAPTSNQSNFSGFYIDDGSSQTQIDDTHATLKPKQSVNDKDNKGSKFNPHMSDQNNVLDIFTFNPTNISRKEIFSVDIRDKICKASGIKNEEFHSAEKLNEYAIVYEKTFNKHFPFIHIPSLKNSRDIEKKVPLILSIAAVGAFCSFERDNAKQLFDVSKLFIKNYLQKELSAERAVLKSAQIDVHQCLVLHVIISLLLNDQGMFDITAKQLKSTVAFMVSTKLHLRTSATIPPPPSMMNKDTDSMRKNYAFFIESQSRIRTIHILHTIEVFRSFFLGSGMTLPFTAIDNGGPSPFETLWSAEDFDSWRKSLEELNFDFNSPIETISNGNFPRDLISSLKGWKTPPSYGFTDTLSSLFYIHERLLDEISKYNNKAFSTSEWRIKSRPKLDNLIHSWEQSYTQLGGILRINEFNKEVIKSNKIFRSIISLHALAKIRSILNISPFLQKAVSQDWNGMRAELKKLSKDEVELREGIDFALETIKLWVLDISATRDSKYRSLDTPFLFLTCLFVSILIIFSYLDAVELGRISVTAFDKQKWLQCRELLLNADSLLAHNKEENQMAKTLKQDNERPLDVGDVGSFLSANNSDTWITQYFKSYKLSSKCLYIGIRILADAPVWPLSVSFAEAIKNVSSDAA